MTSFSESEINRAADGKFAPKVTSESDVDLGANVIVEKTTPDGVNAYRENFDDGNYRRFFVDDEDSAKQYSTYYDADHNYHRDNGPAQIDPTGLTWYQHGRVSRDPMEGPAWIHNDGSCGYMVNGRVVDAPDAATRKNQGVTSWVRHGKREYALVDSSADHEASEGVLHEGAPQPDELDQLEALEYYFYDGRDAE